MSGRADTRSRLVALIAAALVTAGCSAPKRDPGTSASRQSGSRGGPGNPPFYEVFGKRYYVLAAADNYEEVGVASWYGPKFHGKPTSSGVRYDMYAMTAAHKSLPLPTRVRVTHLGNGKSVEVTVNDRGPFVHNRIIDLSYAAAEKLGMIRDGTAMVRVEALEETRRSAAADTGTFSPAVREPSLFLQVGAFGDPANAQRMHKRFAAMGIANVAIQSDRHDLPVLHRVRIGPLDGVAQYDELVELASRMNIHETQLVVEPSAPRPNPGT
jgi:rare lipoprotein A